jgi:hypothetical protein
MRLNSLLVAVVLALGCAALGAAQADHARPGIFSDVGTPPAAEDPAHGNTTTRLMVQRCRSLLRTSRTDEEGHLKAYRHDYSAGFCLGWINASMVFLNVRDTAGNEALGVCLPEGIHSKTVVEAFLDYAQQHEDDLKYNPTFLIYWALLDKYPCKRSG